MVSENEILNGRILIIDDSKTNVHILERMLDTAHFTSVLSTTDPTEAVELYISFLPDLVILDLNMPVMDGFQVMEAFKAIEKGSYMPVLIMTAQSDRETRLKALKAGARDYLTKPFDQLEALNRIKNLLEVRLLHNEVKIQNEQLEEKVQERTKELHDSRLDVIRRLGRASEYRDNETGAHIIRMSKMCALLGKAAGMEKNEVELLLNASPMHDVGKIGIPDNILKKPGKLTQEEFKVIMTHSEIGGTLLEGETSPIMQMARIIALTHHEKWNGTGYPKGLKEKGIPLVGRIAAVCDVFDALTCIRPYKRAWSVEDAMAEIHKLKGVHFDPELVDLFTEILPQIEEIMKQYKEE